MSDNNQWEVVTKSKKQKNFEKKVVAHKEKKKEEALQPKLEEICKKIYKVNSKNIYFFYELY